MTDQDSRAIGQSVETLAEFLWFSVVVTTTFIVVIGPARLLEGDADDWVDVVLGFFGLCFWAAAIWAIAEATVGVRP